MIAVFSKNHQYYSVPVISNFFCFKIMLGLQTRFMTDSCEDEMWDEETDGFAYLENNISCLNNNELDLETRLNELEKSMNVHDCFTNAQIFHRYENFLVIKPKHLYPPSINDTLFKPCCGNYCCINFSP